MTEKQIRLALARAAATDLSDEELSVIAAKVQEFDPGIVDVQSALLAGFCIGYDAGRTDQKAAAVTVSPMADPENWPESWRNGDPAKTGVYVGAAA